MNTIISYIKILFIGIYALTVSFLSLLSAIFDKSFKTYFMTAKLFAHGIFFIGGIKIIVEGLENLDKNGIYVFVSNHSSQFDIPAIQYAVPVNMIMLFKKELGVIPIFGWQLVLGPYVAVDRGRTEKAFQTIEVAKERMVKNHCSVLTFAEGTRSENGEIQAFKRGAFNLAAKVKHPLVPVTISGASKILPKGSFKMRKGIITVTFDKPIDTTNVNTRNDEIELMNKVREVIIKNHKN